MPSTVSEHTPMEQHQVLADEGTGSTDAPSSVPPPTAVPSPAPPVPATLKPNSPTSNETAIETKAVSVASGDCSPGLASPAEASPAKPAVTPPDGSNGTSQTTSCMASASDAPQSTRTRIIPVIIPSSRPFPIKSYIGPKGETEYPNMLTANGVSVTLENSDLWKQFNMFGTEMVVSHQGRRMFPFCSYRLEGLDPERKYYLALSIRSADKYKYRWCRKFQWEVQGPSEFPTQEPLRAFAHETSPLHGATWMDNTVHFNKLKISNQPQPRNSGQAVAHSMQRYIPTLHVIPILPTGGQHAKKLPKSMTFTFPQTEFMAVTAYQNLSVTHLKISLNPFVKGSTVRLPRPSSKDLLTPNQEAAEPRYSHFFLTICPMREALT